MKLLLILALSVAFISLIVFLYRISEARYVKKRIKKYEDYYSQLKNYKPKK